MLKTTALDRKFCFQLESPNGISYVYYRANEHRIGRCNFLKVFLLKEKTANIPF